MNKQQRKEWLIKNQNKIKSNIECGTQWLSLSLMEKGLYSKWFKDLDEKSNKKAFKKTMQSYKEPLAGDKECIGKLDIGKYLEKIRYIENHEEMLVLYVVDNKIIKQKRYIGTFGLIPVADDKLEKLFKSSKKAKTSLYFVHNHPLSVNANFSRGDLYFYGETLCKLSKKYNVKLLDYGVVSFDDYKSIHSEDKKHIIEAIKKTKKYVNDDNMLTPKQKKKQIRDAKVLHKKLNNIIKKDHAKNKKKYG